MDMREAVGTWVSAHLCFPGSLFDIDGDEVIRDVIEPFVGQVRQRGWIDGFFFVRYSDPEAHIRLRVHLPLDVDAAVVETKLLTHVRRVWPDAVIKGGERRPPPEGAHRAVCWVPYVPEVGRYGGQAAMSVAEACFEVSSLTALELLGNSGVRGRDWRLGQALLAMLVMVRVFVQTRSDAAAFAERYWVSQVRPFRWQSGSPMAWRDAFAPAFTRQEGRLGPLMEEAWSRFDQGEGLSPVLDRYHADLVQIREALMTLCLRGQLKHYERPLSVLTDVVRFIVPSYLHMMNNRLGVRNIEEAYLSYLLHHLLVPDPSFPKVTSS